MTKVNKGLCVAAAATLAMLAASGAEAQTRATGRGNLGGLGNAVGRTVGGVGGALGGVNVGLGAKVGGVKADAGASLGSKGLATGVTASVGGRNGLDAAVGASATEASGVRAAVGTSLGGTAGTTATVGAVLDRNSGTQLGVDVNSGAADVGLGLALPGAGGGGEPGSPGAPGTPGGPGTPGTPGTPGVPSQPIAPGLASFDRLGPGAQRALKQRCSTIMSSRDVYDAELVALCRMVASR